MTTRVPPHELDVTAFVTVRLHAHGGLSVSGHIGDPAFARTLLQHGMDAIGRQSRERSSIIVPNRDTDADTALPLREWSTMAPHERGDG